MCGEKAVFDMCSCHSLGSPPHVRGKVACKVQAVCYEGITPACAGKRGCPHSGPGTTRDHPRVCGEKGFVSGWKNGPEGSPPHVRGKVNAALFLVVIFGITPACAGKSHRRSNLHVQQGDHPRMCGEKSLLPSSPSQRMGSPPHVRGKAVKLAQYFDVTGITPACAGKSPSFRMISNKNGDHPRMCGEKTKKIP